MCTLVCRWRRGAQAAIELLALRDELASRAFDLPGRWWPAQPGVVGGRDRAADGTWCATDVDAAVTAVVLNRPERRTAAPGAASRGALPLLAVAELERWPRSIDIAPMASFNLVLVTPEQLRWWSWDGADLTSHELNAGVHLFTPTGPQPDPARFRAANNVGDELTGSTSALWPTWLAIVDGAEPRPDPGALIVDMPAGKDTYRTVFGQLLASRAGVLRVDHAVRPGPGATWTAELWTAAGKRSAAAGSA